MPTKIFCKACGSSNVYTTNTRRVCRYCGFFWEPDAQELVDEIAEEDKQ